MYFLREHIFLIALCFVRWFGILSNMDMRYCSSNEMSTVLETRGMIVLDFALYVHSRFLSSSRPSVTYHRWLSLFFHPFLPALSSARVIFLASSFSYSFLSRLLTYFPSLINCRPFLFLPSYFFSVFMPWIHFSIHFSSLLFHLFHLSTLSLRLFLFIAHLRSRHRFHAPLYYNAIFNSRSFSLSPRFPYSTKRCFPPRKPSAAIVRTAASYE